MFSCPWPMRHLPWAASVLAAFVLVACVDAPRNNGLRAAETRPRTHAITLDDYFTMATIFEVSIAPGGDAVAYSEGRWETSTDDRKTDLWLVQISTGVVSRLTFDRAGYGNLRWGPDGQQLYCSARRKREGSTAPPDDGSAQVWRLARDGELRAMTRVAGGIDLFDLAEDGRALYYATSKQTVSGSWAELRKQFNGLEYGHGRQDVTDISRLDLLTWRTTPVVTLKRAVSELALAPDGKRLAVVTAPRNQVASFEGKSAVEIVDLATGAVETLPDELWRAQASSPYGRLNSLRWSADGNGLAFVIAFDGYPSEIIVARWGRGSPSLSRLPRPEGVSLQASVDGPAQLRWRKGTSELCFVGAQQARARLYCADVADPQAPRHRCLTPGDVVVDSFSVARSGEQIALVLGDPTHPLDVYLMSGGEPPRRLTQVNPQVESWKLPRLSIFRWKGARGATVEGVLELPPDAAGQPFPLIVHLHGGPTSTWTYQFQYTYFGTGLFPGQGYAVLSPNYRGSLGYGDRFVTDLVGHENDIEVQDIIKGVDALIEQGVADPARLGVTGWSNGGYLTNCLVAKTQRFRAASSGAGIADVAMEWGINDEPAFALAFVKGFPWTKSNEFRRVSPLFRAGQIRTPTIFHVGEKDLRCPPQHSRMLYRALNDYLGVPAELVIYPKESHGLSGLTNRKAKMAWDLAWFEQYLNGSLPK